MKTSRVVMAATVLSLSGACAGQASFQGIGALPGYPHSFASALSGDGLVVAGTCMADVPFRWTKGTGMVPLQVSACGGGQIHGLNYDGSVAVGKACYLGSTAPSYWDAQSLLHTLPVSASGNTAVHAVSPNGSIFAGTAAFPGTNPRAARWAGFALPEQLYGPGEWLSSGYAMTPDGSTIVGHATVVGIGTFAAIWSGGARIDLPKPPGSNVVCRGSDVSADGRVVLGYCSNPTNPHPATWRSGGLRLLPLPPGATLGEIAAASADGEIAAGYVRAASGSNTAAVWTRAGIAAELRPLLESFGLSLEGWTLHRAEGVSDDGRTIVGSGENPQGFAEGWIATLPEGFGCYANCTLDLLPSGAAALTVADFGCFQSRFVASDPYADCNNDNALTIADFGCFQTEFVAGCP